MYETNGEEPEIREQKKNISTNRKVLVLKRNEHDQTDQSIIAHSPSV